MKVYQVGIIRNDEPIIYREYIKKVDFDLEKREMDLLKRTILDIISQYNDFKSELMSYELIQYNLTLMESENSGEFKFIGYLITNKGSELNLKKTILNRLMNEFFRKFPEPKCNTLKMENMNGFYKIIDKIIGDLSMEPSERLSYTLGYNKNNQK
ncbi:MAG: hypothetical protein ACTSPY_05340 [Candidatus Helarchaeota archaeon]